MEWAGAFGPVTITGEHEEWVIEVPLVRGGRENLGIRGIQIVAPAGPLIEGGSVGLEAIVEGGPPNPYVIWYSLDPSVADVDGDGVVTAIFPGSATVVARAGLHTAEAGVTVRARVASVEVAPSSVRLTAVGATAGFEAFAFDPRGAPVAGVSVEWSSSDPRVADHVADGVFVAGAHGSAAAIAVIEGVEGSASIEVDLPIATVEVIPESLVFTALGQAGGLEAVARDVEGRVVEGVSFDWSSSDPGVADVDETGLVTAVGLGSATITAAAGAASGEAGVDVIQVVQEILVFPDVVELEEPGMTAQLEAFAFDGNGFEIEGASFLWASSSALVAVVSGSGLVTATGQGVATVTAEVDGITGSAEVTVLTGALGTLTGRVVNALQANPIAGAEVTLAPGGGAQAVSAQATSSPTAVTDANGDFSIPVAAGTYAVAISAAGFIPVTLQDVVVSPDATTNVGTVALSPELSEDEVRIVLTWTVPPNRDLDSHLTGPLSGGSRFHVYFANRGNLNASPFAQLDRDDLVGPGPETITINQSFAGVYRYSVHDWTGRLSTSSSALAGTGARVRVFRGSLQVADFTVPNQPGTLWTVFEMDGLTGAITPIHAMSFQSSSAAIQAPGAEGPQGAAGAPAKEDDAALIRDAVGANPKP